MAAGSASRLPTTCNSFPVVLEAGVAAGPASLGCRHLWVLHLQRFQPDLLHNVACFSLVGFLLLAEQLIKVAETHACIASCHVGESCP